jgi:hypothetical protein
VSKVVDAAQCEDQLDIVSHLQIVDGGKSMRAYTVLLGTCPAPDAVKHADNECIRTKFRRTDSLVLITLAANDTLRKRYTSTIDVLGLDNGIQGAVTTFATLLRGLAYLHSQGVFLVNIAPECLREDDLNNGRFLHAEEGLYYLQNSVLGGAYTATYPLFANPFDCLVLAKCARVQQGPAALPDALNLNPWRRVQLRAPRVDVGLLAKQFAAWKLANIANRAFDSVYAVNGTLARPRYSDEAVSDVPDTVLPLLVLPDEPGAVVDVFAANTEYWATPKPNWGALDVFGLAVAFTAVINSASPDSLSQKTRNLLSDLKACVLDRMTVLKAADRCTAAEAWTAMRNVAVTFVGAVPRVPGSVPAGQAAAAAAIQRFSGGGGGGGGSAGGGGAPAGFVDLTADSDDDPDDVVRPYKRQREGPIDLTDD